MDRGSRRRVFKQITYSTTRSQRDTRVFSRIFSGPSQMLERVSLVIHGDASCCTLEVGCFAPRGDFGGVHAEERARLERGPRQRETRWGHQ